MYYVYLTKNLDTQESYYGYANDLVRRMHEHNKNQKWKLIYYEAYLSESDAREREKKLKHYGQSRTHLKRRLKKSLKI